MSMEIRFWGVRGSIATPGEATATVGGNTTCVQVRCGDQHFILDAGTGIRGLGETLLQSGETQATLLLSHLHWDHIQGLPFFVPLYMPTTRLRVVGPGSPELSLREALASQMRPPTFPVLWEDLPSHVELETVRHGRLLRFGDVEVRVAKLNHPGGGVMAYRLDWKGRSVVFATDTEHYACVDPTLNALAKNADVLIYDAQYTPQEYSGEKGPSRVGWGHSTWEAGVELAAAAGVGRLVLFHHDPKRTDEQVGAIERLAQRRFSTSEAAREGRAIMLAPVGARAA